MPKANAKGRRYSAAQKRRILETAKKEGLSGAQVKKRFGVSTLTFYRWRGPVRGKRSRPRRVSAVVDQGAIREEVRAGIRRVLPQIIRKEVSAALAEMLGRRSG